MKRFALIVAALLAPLAAGHASPDPLDNEVHLLADESSDAYGILPGLDIQDVYVREADFPGLGAGVVIRVITYGGSAAGGEFTFTVEADDVGRLAVSSADLEAWSGDLAVVGSDLDTESGVVAGSLQFFARYDQLGLSIGETLRNVVVRSLHDGDLRDIAPGGIPAPGSGGAVEVPAESTVVNDAYLLTGPTGYTITEVRIEGHTLIAQVENLITAAGQHFFLEADGEGWEVRGDQLSVDAGAHPTLNGTIVRHGEGPLTVTLRSDLGGLETILLTPDAQPSTPARPAPTPTPAATDDGKDTPLPAALALLAIALAVLRHYRRH